MHQNHFHVELTRKERILGICYLPFYLILFSLALEFLLMLILKRNPDPAELNACFYGLNLLIVLLLFRRFLLENLRYTNWKRTLVAVPVALVAYFVITLQVNSIILVLYPDFANQNNNAVISILDSDPVFVVIMSVIMAPIIEESLFRGLIFGSIFRKSRVLAYLVTILCFAAIHVVSYLGVLTPVEIALSILQYVPASLVLCAAYQLTDSLITPILLHACINLIACLLMSTLL